MWADSALQISLSAGSSSSHGEEPRRKETSRRPQMPLEMCAGMAGHPGGRLGRTEASLQVSTRLGQKEQGSWAAHAHCGA